MSDEMPTPNGPARRRRRARWPLALVLLLGLLAAGEVAVRLLGLTAVPRSARTAEQRRFEEGDMFVPVDAPGLHYRNRPGARVTAGGIVYVHDERGRRVTPGSTPPDAPAIAFLGDSTCYGLGVAADETLPAQVAAALRHRAAALNLGVNGYTTVQEAALYRHEREHLPGVEVVVLVFYANDMTRGRFRWDPRARVMYMDELPLPRGPKRLLWRSGLYRALANWHARGLVADGWNRAEDPSNWPPALDALGRLAEDVAADGRRLLVAHLPVMAPLERDDAGGFADDGLDAIADAVAERCAELSVPFVDLLPAFQEVRARELADYEARHGAPPPPGTVEGFLSRYWIVYRPQPDGPPEQDIHQDGAANAIAAAALAGALAPLLED